MQAILIENYTRYGCLYASVEQMDNPLLRGNQLRLGVLKTELLLPQVMRQGNLSSKCN
jgi:hypothetical protein